MTRSAGAPDAGQADSSLAEIAGPALPASGEVHIWTVGLGASRETVAHLLGTLSLDERERAARRRLEHDRRRFTVAHGVLRGVLAGYLGTRASRIGFVHSASGKPALGPEWSARLRFSLTHSADLALVAVAAGADVGVDVERVRVHRDWAEIARGYFSAAECHHLASDPNHRRPAAFARCWTRNEARLKARGDCLAGPLAGVAGDVADAGRWSIHTLRPAPGYIGALAIEGARWRLRYRRWPGVRTTLGAARLNTLRGHRGAAPM